VRVLADVARNQALACLGAPAHHARTDGLAIAGGGVPSVHAGPRAQDDLLPLAVRQEDGHVVVGEPFLEEADCLLEKCVEIEGGQDAPGHLVDDGEVARALLLSGVQVRVLDGDGRLLSHLAEHLDLGRLERTEVGSRRREGTQNPRARNQRQPD